MYEMGRALSNQSRDKVMVLLNSIEDCILCVYQVISYSSKTHKYNVNVKDT
jgi:hypothetical protein